MATDDDIFYYGYRKLPQFVRVNAYDRTPLLWIEVLLANILSII